MFSQFQLDQLNKQENDLKIGPQNVNLNDYYIQNVNSLQFEAQPNNNLFNFAEYQPNKKTSKKILNQNAIKFRLQNLRTDNIRYEVIYKNLARDMRKFYSTDFKQLTDYLKQKKQRSFEFFMACLRAYIKRRFGQETERMGVNID